MTSAPGRSGLCRAGFIALAMTLGLAHPAPAQPGMLSAYIPIEHCPYMPGLMLLTYSKIQTYEIHELSEICLDPAGPHLYGSEPITGLTFAEQFHPYSVGYEVVVPEAPQHARVELSFTAIWDPLDDDESSPDMVESPFATAAIWELGASYPSDTHRSARHDDRDFLDTLGYVAASLQDDASFPAGIWDLTFTIYPRPHANARSDIEYLVPGTHFLSSVTFDGTQPVSVSFDHPLYAVPGLYPPFSDMSVGLAIADGRLGASVQFEMTNPRAPEVRTRDEWHTARVEAPLIVGHVARGASGSLMRGLGVGRMILRDGQGRVEVWGAKVEMKGAPQNPHYDRLGEVLVLE